MSVLEMKVPSPGESIFEVEIAEWLVEDGDYVEKDQAIAEIDSDKATLELPAEESGTITLKAEDGEVVKVGQVVCLIDTSAKKPEGSKPKEEKKEEKKEVKDEGSKSTKDAKPDPMPAAEKKSDKSDDSHAKGHPSPAARKMMDENGVSSNQIKGTGKGGRITQQDVVNAMSNGFDASTTKAGEAQEKRAMKKCQCSEEK